MFLDIGFLMEESNVLERLIKEGIKSEDLADKATANKDLLIEIFKGVSAQNPEIKFQSVKILRFISEHNPELLYPKMDFFVKLMESDNNVLKWTAMDLVANLAKVDNKNKLNKLFDFYYDFIDDKSMITAAHVVDNSGKIALAKPELRERITKLLINLENDPRESTECTNILIGKAILSLQQYYDQIYNKTEVISFVRRQLLNTRKATKTKAEKFLKRNKIE